MMDGRAYRFETDDQWRRCLRMRLAARRLLAADRGALLAMLAEAPLGFLASDGNRFAWIGQDGALRRESGCAGPTLGAGARLAESGRQTWALADETLLRIDGASLQLLDMIAQPGAVDIAPDVAGGVWALTDSAILRLNGRGGLRATIQRPVPADRIAVADEALFLLDVATNVLTLLRRDGSPLRIALDRVAGETAGAFTAREISSGRDSVLLAGDWDGAPGFLALDSVGDPVFWGQWEDGPPLFVRLLGESLCALFDEADGWAVRLFEHAADSGGELALTPALESDTLAGEWLRAQVTAKLPPGATLSITWAATGDEALAALARGVFADAELSHDARLRKVRAILPWSEPITYSGPLDADPIAAEAFAAPLGEARGNHLWLEAAIHRNEAAQAPAFVSLIVAHDTPGLMNYLPAVYRTPTGDGDGALLRLVQVLEATFLGFDEEIGKLADRFDPERAEARWLGALAQLLGLPFDDALDTAARRALLRAAPRIIAGRGTRAGVRALLTAVLGERPYRIVDRTEQFMPITLGGARVPGARLPGFLAGPSTRAPKLNARLVLGRTPLGMSAPEMVSRAPELLVVAPVTGVERRRLGAALRQMLEALIPAGVRLDLRWIEPGRATSDAVLGVLAEWPTMTLGAGMPTGGARLGGSCEPRLRDDGVAAEHRLA